MVKKQSLLFMNHCVPKGNSEGVRASSAPFNSPQAGKKAS
jgi:hypothetical protein